MEQYATHVVKDGAVLSISSEVAKAVGVTDPTCMIFFTESCKPTSI